MSALLVGYARCFTDAQDLTAQRDALATLGVSPERIYVDHGLTGTIRSHRYHTVSPVPYGLTGTIRSHRNHTVSPEPYGLAGTIRSRRNQPRAPRTT